MTRGGVVRRIHLTLVAISLGLVSARGVVAQDTLVVHADQPPLWGAVPELVVEHGDFGESYVVRYRVSTHGDGSPEDADQT